MHALTTARNRTTLGGGTFVVVLGDNELVRQVLELIGLESVFPTAPSVDAALAVIDAVPDVE